jgi:formylmethanofuran dehydrogenase subunit E
MRRHLIGAALFAAGLVSIAAQQEHNVKVTDLRKSPFRVTTYSYHCIPEQQQRQKERASRRRASRKQKQKQHQRYQELDEADELDDEGYFEYDEEAYEDESSYSDETLFAERVVIVNPTTNPQLRGILRTNNNALSAKKPGKKKVTFNKDIQGDGEGVLYAKRIDHQRQNHKVDMEAWRAHKGVPTEGDFEEDDLTMAAFPARSSRSKPKIVLKRERIRVK